MDGIPEWVQEKRCKGVGRNERYPFSKIKVGETFVILKEEQTCSFKSFRVMAHTRATKLGRKFFVRLRPDDGAFEVWREA